MAQMVAASFLQDTLGARAFREQLELAFQEAVSPEISLSVVELLAGAIVADGEVVGILSQRVPRDAAYAAMHAIYEATIRGQERLIRGTEQIGLEIALPYESLGRTHLARTQAYERTAAEMPNPVEAEMVGGLAEVDRRFAGLYVSLAAEYKVLSAERLGAPTPEMERQVQQARERNAKTMEDNYRVLAGALEAVQRQEGSLGPITRMQTLRDQGRLERAYGDYLRLQNVKPGEAVRHLTKGDELREQLNRLILSAQAKISLRPPPAEESGPAAGLEEGGVRVETVAELGVRARTLQGAPVQAPEWATHALLIPDRLLRQAAQEQPSVLHVYAQESVSLAAVSVLPRPLELMQMHDLPEDPAQLEEALRKMEPEGRAVIVLDAKLQDRVRRGEILPKGHDLALLVDPVQWEGYTNYQNELAALLAAPPERLQNWVVLLTAGTVVKVRIDGEDFTAIFA